MYDEGMWRLVLAGVAGCGCNALEISPLATTVGLDLAAPRDTAMDLSRPGGGWMPVAGGPRGTVSRVFVTNETWTGDLRSAVPGAASGPEAADALCNRAALQGLYGGNFVAWLSDDTHSAIERIVLDVGPWMLLTGETVFADKAAMTSGAALFAIHITENGADKNWTASGVWTGTTVSGGAAVNNCHNWTDTSTSGESGTTRVTDGGWTENAVDPCFAHQSLYCFEQ
jgi:hypothetical protein